MELGELANQLVSALKDRGERIVFAESCTGGLVAASMATVPGVSDWLCGSAVTYRGDTKIRWIGVCEQTINQHTAVSGEVAEQMVRGVLQRTPEANWAASVTGHLGPNAPAELDGIVFVGVAKRKETADAEVHVSRHRLSTENRAARQQEAAGTVMRQILAGLRISH